MTRFTPLFRVFAILVGAWQATGAIAVGPVEPVVIVGGGIGGLTAAYELKKEGVSAQIYTNEERIGGRIKSPSRLINPDIVVNAGAELIDSDHRNLLKLMSELGLETISTEVAPDLRTGGFLWQGRDMSEQELHQEIARTSEKALNRMREDQKLLLEERARIAKAGGKEAGPLEKALDKKSLSQYLAEVDAPPLLRDYMTSACVSETGIPAEKLSASMTYDLMEIRNGPTDLLEFLPHNDEAFRVKGGTIKIVEALKDQLEKAPLTLHTLVSIESADMRTFKLGFTTRKGMKYVQAKNVILALPYSTLRRVNMKFPQSHRIQMAAGRTTYGRHGKLIMHFDERTWNRQGHSGSFLSDKGIQFWDSSAGQAGKAGTMTAYVGNIAQHTHSEALTNQMLDDLEKKFPGIKSAYRGSELHYWDRSYSGSMQVGERSNRNHPFVKKLGGLRFAGEHLSENYFGYMEGAVETGIQAADDIKRQLGAPPPVTNPFQCFMKQTRSLVHSVAR